VLFCALHHEHEVFDQKTFLRAFDSLVEIRGDDSSGLAGNGRIRNERERMDVDYRRLGQFFVAEVRHCLPEFEVGPARPEGFLCRGDAPVEGFEARMIIGLV